MSVFIPSELEARIRVRLQEFIAESIPDPVNLRKIAVSLNALPLYLESGGGYALRPNGEIISFLWDAPHETQVEDNLRIRNMVLFQGSKKYPELKALVPPRPPGAVECPYCKGTGVDPMAAKLNTDTIVCYCGGLGWLPYEAA